jgi:DtxR family transcriptional regulator, Mn-dependent transcriptional regulator
VTAEPPPPPALTASAEDYLKAVYAAERAGDAAATGDLAQRLGVAAPSVSGMMRRLADQGLLTFERYRGARLTPAGRRVALRTLRRHRILECYLATALGYPWDRVHAEAERLEHAASDELIERMAVALGNPTVDPHGAPIPTADGAVVETEYVSLAALAVGRRSRVARVSEHDAGMLRYMDELGIRPGAHVVVTARAPYDGPLTLEVGGDAVSVGPAIATRVMVDCEAAD